MSLAPVFSPRRCPLTDVQVKELLRLGGQLRHWHHGLDLLSCGLALGAMYGVWR